MRCCKGNMKLVVGCLMLCFVGVWSQDFEYNLMFMENKIEDNIPHLDMEIFISSKTGTDITVTIDNPFGGIIASETFALGGSNVAKRTISKDIRMVENSVGYSAVRIRANGDMIIYALNRNTFSSDGFAVFNNNQIGSDYYAAAYSPETLNTEVGIIATESGLTTIRIRVPHGNDNAIIWDGNTYNQGSDFTITLAQYQTAQVQTRSGDITGAWIRSVNEKNFALFSGNTRTSVDGSSRDHLVEQMPPTVQWGYDYYTIRTPARTSDRDDKIRIIAKDDNTIVTVSGALSGTYELNAGRFQELSAFGATWITSNNPVLVIVVSSSQSLTNPLDVGDPSMVVVPARGQYSNDFRFITPSYQKPPNADTDSYEINLLIVAQTTEANRLIVGNTRIMDNWQEIAGSNYSINTYPLQEGRRYMLSHPNNDAKFMALLYGSADRESFYFPIDVGKINVNIITPITIYGEKGAEGDRGPQGATGAVGIKGARGVQGATGSRGNRGQKGVEGDRGFDGLDSPTGATGATGPAGTGGFVGATGPKGVKGQIGSIGDIGSTGSTGSVGPSGDRGLQGVVGQQGIAGPQGYRGSEGQKGDQGDKGEIGVTGSQGGVGEVGPKGFVSSAGCLTNTGENVCTVRGSTLDATCRPIFGSVNHLCGCPNGYHLIAPDYNECVDLDECDLDFCSHGCTNTAGSFTCSCPSGYTLNGTNCEDTNECETVGICDDSQTCLNGIGSYICAVTKPASGKAGRLQGLQVLYNDAFFIAMLILLAFLTILLIIVASCLLVRHRKRYTLEKRRRQLMADQAPPVFYPASSVLQDGYY